MAGLRSISLRRARHRRAQIWLPFCGFAFRPHSFSCCARFVLRLAGCIPWWLVEPCLRRAFDGVLDLGDLLPHASMQEREDKMTISNYRTTANAGIPLLFHIEHRWPRAAECLR